MDSGVFLRVLNVAWSDALANGAKFVETQGYTPRSKNGNAMKSLKSGDLVVFAPSKKGDPATRASRKVAGVAEVAGVAIRVDGIALQSDLLRRVDGSLLADLEKYLNCFCKYDYVIFSKVFDLRGCQLTLPALGTRLGVHLPEGNQGFVKVPGDGTRAALLDLCCSEGVLRVRPASWLPENPLGAQEGAEPRGFSQSRSGASNNAPALVTVGALCSAGGWVSHGSLEETAGDWVSDGSVLLRRGSYSDGLSVWDLQIPPLSWTTLDRVEENQELLWSVLSAEGEQLEFRVGCCVHAMLGSGDQFRVRSGELYQLGNRSSMTPVVLKLVVVRNDSPASEDDVGDLSSSPVPTPAISDEMPGLFDEDGDLCLERSSGETPQFRGRLFKP